MDFFSNELLFAITPIFFAIAFVYSIAGFGGGSSYIAVLAISGIAFQSIPVISLSCNIVVVGASSVMYWKNNILDFRKVIPFVLGSVPFAFLGGLIPISEKVFYFLLGISLIIAGLHLIFFSEKSNSKNADLKSGDLQVQNVENQNPSIRFLLYSLIGSVFGFLSGLTGIGGGIFLAPMLYFMRYAESKVIASICSLFILVNSIAGLTGQLTKASDFSVNNLIYFFPLIFAVLLGGILGSVVTIRIFSKGVIRISTAALILYAGIRIAIK